MTLQTIPDLYIQKEQNEAMLQAGKIQWLDYIKEDLRLAHEIRMANLILQAEMISEILAAREAQVRERHLTKLGGLI